MATLKLEIVTPDKLSFQGEVDSVVIPASEGEMGILPMHIPLVTQIKPGELVITRGHKKEYLAVGEGFVTVTHDTVNVLTDMAIESEHIDEGAAEAAVKRARTPSLASTSWAPRKRRPSRRRLPRASPSCTSSAAGTCRTNRPLAGS